MMDEELEDDGGLDDDDSEDSSALDVRARAAEPRAKKLPFTDEVSSAIGNKSAVRRPIPRFSLI